MLHPFFFSSLSVVYDTLKVLMGRRPSRFVDDAMSSLLTRAAHSISLPFLQAAEKHGLNATEWRIMATLL